MRRYLVPLIFGLGGAAILISLALWQVQRLGWKEDLIAALQARAVAAPVALPEAPEEARDAFLSVTVEGRFVGEALHVLTSTKFGGPGFRVVQGFQTGGRMILVDRGYLPEVQKGAALDPGPLTVTGALLWPNETDSFTPDPNRERNIWFARDPVAMAEVLGTEPLLLVASRPTGDPAPQPLPIGVNLPNNHLQYAITWSLLALCWLAMTGFLLYRIRAKTH